MISYRHSGFIQMILAAAGITWLQIILGIEDDERFAVGGNASRHDHREVNSLRILHDALDLSPRPPRMRGLPEDFDSFGCVIALRVGRRIIRHVIGHSHDIQTIPADAVGVWKIDGLTKAQMMGVVDDRHGIGDPREPTAGLVASPPT
jgi:hypothetical protein